jgi:hypothetical protein
VANALVHAERTADTHPPQGDLNKLDRRYLSKLRCDRRLDAWQQMAGSDLLAV